MRLVADGHLHGKAQALLVNSPVGGDTIRKGSFTNARTERAADVLAVSPYVRHGFPVLVV